MDNKPLKVLTSREGKDGKKYWCKLGAAWRRDNGSISVQLDGLPVTGSLLIVEDDGKYGGGGSSPDRGGTYAAKTSADDDVNF